MQRLYVQSEQVLPTELRPGDKIGTSWGFPTLESVVIQGSHYLMTFAPDAHGVRPTVRAHLGDLPCRATGRRVPKCESLILYAR